MGRKRSRNKRAIQELSVIENYYTSMLLNIYSSVYEWKGLPPTVDPRYLEMSLIQKGKVLFFNEEAVGLVAFPARAASQLSPYGYPYRWMVFGQNGYSREVLNRDGVYCYNTNNTYTDWAAILMFAQRFVYVDTSIDVNIAMQRFPGVIITSEEKKLSMENLMQDYEAGKYLIYGKQGLDIDDFQHIDFKTPYVADKLEYTKRDIMADALNYIGIQYSSSNKKERLASTEIDSNIGFTEANRSAHLFPRQDCARRLSEKFGLDITVDIRDDMVNKLKIADINPNNDQNVSRETLYGESGERK